MADRVISYDFRANFASLVGGLATAGASVNAFGTKLTALDANGAKMRAGLNTLGGAAGKVGLVAAAGLGAAAKAAVDWETAWAGVAKTVDGTVSEMAELEDGLRNLAQTMPATHEEIAATAEAAGQLGVAKEDIVEFTRTMLMLGETTNLSADEAATAIAQMANVMGTAPDEIDNLGAALVALGNDGASTEAQILGMAQRIAGAGAQIGLAESDILGIANAAASMGIEVEAGGTAISRVFTDMAKATSQGGDDLTAFAEVAGVSAEEFARVFAETPAQAFAMFTEGLDRINKSGGDVFTTLDGLGLADVRVSQALLGMAASGDLLSDSLDTGANAFKQNTALADEFAKRLGTTGAEVRVAFNNIKDAAIDVGAALLPTISTIADKVSSLAQSFGELPGPVKKSTAGLLGITAILGGGLWFTSKVVNGIVATNTALVQLGITSKATSISLAGVAKSAGLIAVAYTAIDTGINIIDAFARQAAAADSTSESFKELRQNLEESNVGKYADDFGIDLDRLAAEMLEFGDKGTYYAEAIDKMGAANDGFGGKLRQFGGFLSPFIGDAEKAQLATMDLGNIIEGIGETFLVLEASDPDFIGPTLKEAAAAAAAAGGATENFSDALLEAADAAKIEAKAVREGVKAMREKRDATLAAFDAETAYRLALKEAEAQGRRNSAGIKGNSEAALNNRSALSQLASAWNNQSEAVKNNGERFRESRRAFIDTATAMGVPEKAAKRLADQILDIPKSRAIKIAAETAAANAAIEETKRRLAYLNGMKATVSIVTMRSTVGTGVGPAYRAEGGQVRGPGGPREDKIPAMLSDGEFVMQAAAVDRYGLGFMYDINSMQAPVGRSGLALAAGGLVACGATWEEAA